MKQEVNYILQHKDSGFYVKPFSAYPEYTTNRNAAKLWLAEEGEKGEKMRVSQKEEKNWQTVMEHGEHKVIKRIETTTVEYEEVEF